MSIRFRIIIWLLPLFWLGMLVGCIPTPAQQVCPVTAAPEPPFVPPDDTPATPPGDLFWYGSPALWTALPPGGVWSARPRDDGGYVQKSVWWREGYIAFEERQPDLIVSGRQLDGDAAFREDGPATHGVSSDSGQFMLMGISIPAAGCWEITGQYSDETLSYVVWIEGE